MGEGTDIEWCHHTFNPWWGCVRVSPGCERCYAEAFAKRTGNAVWGVKAPRRFFGDKHWSEPLKWAEKAAKAGIKHRVFCASMADVFEDRDDLIPHRSRLWQTIEATHTQLDWLLLTKRPENIQRLGNPSLLEKCWIGTTAEDQKRADERIPLLLSTPAAVRFVSAEPLLGPIDFNRIGNALFDREKAIRQSMNGPSALNREQAESTIAHSQLSWVIVGGESGPGARPCDVEWIRSVVKQCAAAKVPVFVKQLGSKPCEIDIDEACSVEYWPTIRLRDRKGGDMSEWSPDLRVREFPR